MKKIFFALAALVLAFTGCSQEEDAIQVSEKKAVKVVVNMDKPGFGEDTRAARQGWEKNDVVGIILNDDFEHVLFLNYSGTAWESESFFLEEEGSDKYYTYDEDEYCNPTPEHEAKKADYFSNISASGNLKAIYCSSGLYYFDPIFEGDELVGTEYLSYASYDEENLMGECIMTCDNGTYEVEETADGYVLKLTITMIPQVAQFTIKDLNKDDDYYVEYTGTMTAYAGGTITPAGVELNPVGEPGYEYGAWVHDNKDGISIYASPWQVAPEGFNMALLDEVGGLGYFCFTLYDADYNRYYRDFQDKKTLKNGGAVIFDGPTTVGAEDKWKYQEK